MKTISRPQISNNSRPLQARSPENFSGSAGGGGGAGLRARPFPGPDTGNWATNGSPYNRRRGESNSEVHEMNAQAHWDTIYTEKAPDAVSWYAPHLETSLALIERLAGGRAASIIDIGGGRSTLVDDLLMRGYEHLTVLDISRVAIEATRTRLGQAAEGVRRVQWIDADITKCRLEPGAFDLWHDRAVFHFLTDANDRAAYVEQVSSAVKRGGHVVVGTFGPEGPLKCSGLDVMRYDAESMREAFGARFLMLESTNEWHRTPFGTMQQFLYCSFKVV
jgi:SAM-dependent methyltransferase